MYHTLLNSDDYEIIFSTEIEKMIDETTTNGLVENSGVTIKNVVFPVKNSIILTLKDISKTFICGNVFKNLFIELQKEFDNKIIIIDFKDVEELSESFYNEYAKILLESTNKIITINMNTALSNEFSHFILMNIQETEDV